MLMIKKALTSLRSVFTISLTVRVREPETCLFIKEVTLTRYIYKNREEKLKNMEPCANFCLLRHEKGCFLGFKC